MVDPREPTNELKIRAEILHKRIASGDVRARARLRVLAELAKVSVEALDTAAANIQRKHCLAVVARETGFSTWDHALRVLRGDASERDLGTLLHDRETSATLNAWFADHAEARAHLDERRSGGSRVFLLAYKRQFLVVDGFYIEALGLDPDDPDWAALDFDWARPRDRSARTRLIMKRLIVLRGRE